MVRMTTMKKGRTTRQKMKMRRMRMRREMRRRLLSADHGLQEHVIQLESPWEGTPYWQSTMSRERDHVLVENVS
jgi:hypothetical protein